MVNLIVYLCVLLSLDAYLVVSLLAISHSSTGASKDLLLFLFSCRKFGTGDGAAFIPGALVASL